MICIGIYLHTILTRDYKGLRMNKINNLINVFDIYELV